MAAPQAVFFNTKVTKGTKSTSPFAFFVFLVSFVLKDSACGAHPLSDHPASH